MRAIILAVFTVLAFTGEANAGEQPMPWKLSPEQLGPLLKEQYQKAESMEKFHRHFVHPGDFGNEILCTSEVNLIKWRDGSAGIRNKLIVHKKCIHEPIGWYWTDFVTNPKTGALVWHYSLWFIDPTGTTKHRLWTLAALYQMNKPSCEEEIGLKRANKLVEQCLDASPATNPPCNVANTCQMVTSEIIWGCGKLQFKPEDGIPLEELFKTKEAYASHFCKDYVNDWMKNIE